MLTSETLAWRGLPGYRSPNSPVASIILPAPNQSPNKKKVDSPLRISHLINEKASGLSLSGLRQSQESLFDSFTSQNDPISINSIRAQATHRDPDKEKNFKISPKAKTLDAPLSFPIPKSPSHSGRQSSSQDTFALWWSLGEPDHRNALQRLYISFRHAFGNKNAVHQKLITLDMNLKLVLSEPN